MIIRINGEVVPEEAIQYEFDRLVKFYSAHMSADEIKSQADLLKEKAREQAVGAKLLMNEAARLDIRVPPEDVEERFRTLVRDAGGDEKFAGLLKARSISADTVRKSIEQGRRVDLLVEKITAGVAEPTEGELLEHYKKHENEYRKPERAKVDHILVRFDATDKKDKEIARSRIEEIRHRVKDGADFADQAAAHSDCPSGKKAGGSLGWISRGMTIPDFDRTVFSMAVGELSEVIETPLGFHIIAKTGHEKGGKSDFGEVRERIRDFLRHSYRGEVLATYVNELKGKAIIEQD
jgi:parvulin-like peptidyl-prolyl isomerase